jgi:hypothetical protein
MIRKIFRAFPAWLQTLVVFMCLVLSLIIFGILTIVTQGLVLLGLVGILFIMGLVGFYLYLYDFFKK